MIFLEEIIRDWHWLAKAIKIYNLHCNNRVSTCTCVNQVPESYIVSYLASCTMIGKAGLRGKVRKLVFHTNRCKHL